ncbi:MAG: 3-oxoacyl-ACP reductase FabG [Anaerolineae bacterium]|nr:3-oxoacyl-ACP reductase FabG [Anaerolineae bacterium]
MKGLNGKVALVTGAARGIGATIAITLAEYGCDIAINDIGAESQAEPVIQHIRNLGRRAEYFQANVADREQVSQMVAAVLQALGGLDILVNNAGIIRRGSFLDHSVEDWNAVLNVNLWGTFHCCQEVLPHMVSKQRGAIVNVSSIAGKIGDITGAASYGTSKGAINALTKSLAREFAPQGITINAVAPHAIETEMSAQWTDEKRRQIVESLPMKRLGTPEDVAEAVAFLASDGARFITGEVMNINGGSLMD